MQSAAAGGDAGYHRQVPALSQTRAYAALLLIATLWGTFPATGKLAVQDFPPVFLTAVCVSALGVLVVVTDGRLWRLRLEDLRAGDFITLVGLVAWMAYTVYGKRVVSTHSPALTTTAAYVAGTCILAAEAALTAPLFPRPLLTSTRAWAVVFYHAICGAIAHI